MVGFMFLGNKVCVKAVEVVGHAAVRWKPAAKPATQTIMKQQVVFVAAGARGNGCGLLSEEVALRMAVIMAGTGNNSLQTIHLPDVP